ncbi:MAG: transposase [Bacilli bacterium]
MSKSKGPNKNGCIDDGRCDMDADFTIKENYYKDPKTGESKARKKTYFGYRYHLLADVNYELPVEYTVTKASVGERDELKKHIEMLNNEKVETLSADKGYDGKTLITYLVNKGIKPIIDIRCQWRDGEKTKQYKDTDLLYTYDGKVSIIDENNENIPLKYLGYDKVKNTLRYQHKSNVYSIDINYDKRIFTQIARDSKKWKRIYNKRTALERINGRFDRDFNLENHKVRGLKKATVLIDIMMIGMMAMAKGHILNNHPENIRKLKSM